jgi:hypothetical protein
MDKIKYINWYNDICSRGKVARPEKYTESHHIVPEAFYKNRKRKGKAGWLDGNPDSPENITLLTGKEHAIAHHLLTKIYHDDKRAYPKVIRALEMMGTVNPNQKGKREKLIPRIYEKAREERAKLQREEMKGENNPMFGTTWSDERKKAHSEKVKGNKLTPEQHARLVQNTKGKKKKPFSDSHKENLSKNHASKKLGFDGSRSDATKKKIGDSIRGRKQTEEEKQKRSEANKGKRREKSWCPWCNVECPVNTYPRFHGHNCHCNPHSERFGITPRNGKKSHLVVDFLNWIS